MIGLVLYICEKSISIDFNFCSLIDSTEFANQSYAGSCIRTKKFNFLILGKSRFPEKSFTTSTYGFAETTSPEVKSMQLTLSSCSASSTTAARLPAALSGE